MLVALYYILTAANGSGRGQTRHGVVERRDVAIEIA
jgi:hypothetical protein